MADKEDGEGVEGGEDGEGVADVEGVEGVADVEDAVKGERVISPWIAKMIRPACKRMACPLGP